jgi:hypothetical protein
VAPRTTIERRRLPSARRQSAKHQLNARSHGHANAQPCSAHDSLGIAPHSTDELLSRLLVFLSWHAYMLAPLTEN